MVKKPPKKKTTKKAEKKKAPVKRKPAKKKAQKKPGRVAKKHWHQGFIIALEQHGIVAVACRKCKIPRNTALDHYKKDEKFRAAWEEAIAEVDAVLALWPEETANGE